MDKIVLYKLTAPFVDCNLSLHDTIGAFLIYGQKNKGKKNKNASQV